MRKIMLMAAMLALVAVVAVVPALANENDDDNGLIDFGDCFPFCDDGGDWWNDDDNGDDHNGDDHDGDDYGDDHKGDDNGDDSGSFEVIQAIGQEAESGDVAISNEVSNEGDNSNVCAPALQFANTGNLQNAQGFAQYGSETGDIEFGGSAFVFAPELEASCDQSIEQSAVAYGW